MEKPRAPLPPGVVPSDSREDMSDLLEREEAREVNIVKEGSLGGKESKKEGDETEPTDPIVLSGTPPKAWPSPEQPQRFHMDLSAEGEAECESGITHVPVRDTNESDEEDSGTEKKIWSPFGSKPKSTVQDLRREALFSGKKPQGTSEQQTTPRRPMSPMKRFNKVAPITTPANPSSTFLEQEHTPLQSSSASILNDMVPNAKEERSRSGSAPVQIGEDPLSAASSEPQYSTVVKVKPAKKPPEPATPPEILAAMPKLDCYEPTADVDTTTVIVNPSVAQPTNLSSSSGQGTLYDPTYDTVDAPEGVSFECSEAGMPNYDPALYKGLKKHDDKGNVHLVSVKGISDMPMSESMNFPQGSSQDMQPIHYAAANGNKKLLSEILSVLPIMQDPVEMVLGTNRMCKREGVDVMDSEGRTALMHAVHNDRIQCVKLLAEAGANVNGTSSDGSSCLHQAAYSGTVEMVALLLSLGADGLKRDNEGRTPLHWCTNNSNSECIEILLDKVPTFDVNVRDGAMMTSLMWAAFHGKPEHIEKLKERGADPSLADMDGMTAIHWSVQRHDTRALQVLINSESSRYCDNKGKTVMHQAAEQGCAKAVSLIKAVRPTSVDDLDANDRTPLHWATVCENPEVIRALLANGANPSIRDSSGRTALEYATEKGLHYCALLLTKAGAVDETDAGYHSFLTYGTSSASTGARALQQQEGVLLDAEEVKKALTKEQIFQMQTVCRGSWISKFTNDGKGPLHPRFFWVEPSSIKVCWSKDSNPNGKDKKSDILVGVRSSASPAVFGRKDFDPLHKHKYAFTIFTATRVLDVIALSSDDFKIWLNGLQLLLHLGSVNASRVMNLLNIRSDD